jgi:hypothetical protein
MCGGDKVVAEIKKARDLNTTRPELLVESGAAEKFPGGMVVKTGA